jgi:hypothetical protein
MTFAPEARGYVTELVLRDAQTVGKPYRYLEGQAVPYDTWADIGWFMESHDSGSMAQTTKAGTGRGLPLLLFHDNRSFPVGVAESWTHDGGLRGVWRLNDTVEAQRAAKAAEDGELVGLSVGFQPIRSDWTYVDDWDPDLGPDHKDRVVRLESRLLEVSLTPTPAYVDAGVQIVRTAFDIQTRQALVRPKRLEADAWRDTVDELRSAQH